MDFRDQILAIHLGGNNLYLFNNLARSRGYSETRSYVAQGWLQTYCVAKYDLELFPKY